MQPSHDSARSARLDELARELTAFSSFAALLGPFGDEYFPSIYPRTAEDRELADAYDDAQIARGDVRRAFRGLPRARRAFRGMP